MHVHVCQKGGPQTFNFHSWIFIEEMFRGEIMSWGDIWCKAKGNFISDVGIAALLATVAFVGGIYM